MYKFVSIYTTKILKNHLEPSRTIFTYQAVPCYENWRYYFTDLYERPLPLILTPSPPVLQSEKLSSDNSPHEHESVELEDPEQDAPSQEGAGLSHCLVRVVMSRVQSHELHDDHPPQLPFTA